MPRKGTMLIPTVRLLPIMQDWLARGNKRDDLSRGLNAWRKVLKQEFVDERVADHLLSALERNDAWHDELADLWAEMLALEAVAA